MKIKEEQLETIRKHRTELNNLLNDIGYLETQKHGLMHQVAETNKKVEDFKTELFEEYGAINIDIEKGTYTLVEKEDKNETLKVMESV
jgi:predicted  nucleic acid-binding Zn-ribbon protein